MKKRQIDTYAEAVVYLDDMLRFTKKNSMENTRAFLERLGNPEQDMKIIHVAGTNGKGSVCAYLRAVLEEAGYTCCVFTSPHLVSPRERFLLKGEKVSEEAFLKAFQRVYETLDGETSEGGYHPTFFEYLFFMSMLLFAEAGADYCILETGLGGRLDATNSIGKKEISIITKIGYDHMQQLGNHLGAIAGEKAGIIARNTPVVFLEQEEEVNEAVRKRANELEAPVNSLSKSDYTLLNFKNKSIDFSYHSRYYGYVSLHLNTIALYQTENAALAVRALEILDEGRTITAKQITAGLEKAFWAGRMEEVEPEVYVDGAHNIDGIRAFLETVGKDGFSGGRHLVFSVVRDKDYEEMVKTVAQSRLFDRISLVQMQGKRAIQAEELKEVFRKYASVETTGYSSVQEGYTAVKARSEGMRIYVAGSLYLAGEIKELLERCEGGALSASLM